LPEATDNAAAALSFLLIGRFLFSQTPGRAIAAIGAPGIAVLVNAENPLHPFLWDDIQPAGSSLGLKFRLFPVSNLNMLPATFSAVTQGGFDALTVLSDAQFNSARRQISGLAATHRLPTMYEAREFVQDGGLISYGPNITDLSRRAAAFVVKVLNGAKPADLPIEQDFIWSSISRPLKHSISTSRRRCSPAPTR
jgi:ABC-type uncharacterized transport system substrate-binding protein